VCLLTQPILLSISPQETFQHPRSKSLKQCFRWYLCRNHADSSMSCTTSMEAHCQRSLPRTLPGHLPESRLPQSCVVTSGSPGHIHHDDPDGHRDYGDAHDIQEAYNHLAIMSYTFEVKEIQLPNMYKITNLFEWWSNFVTLEIRHAWVILFIVWFAAKSFIRSPVQFSCQTCAKVWASIEHT
jgi:hypothetical protein